MSTIILGNITTTTKGDTAGTANSIVLRDVNGAVTHLGAIINGNLAMQTANTVVNTISANKTLDATGGVWVASGAITITLPTIAAVGNGRSYRVFKTDASNTITVNTSDASTINGAASVTLTSQYQSRFFFTDGTNWFTL